MKYVESCLSAREDRGRCFHRCGCSVRLVQACLCEGETSQCRFKLRRGAVKLGLVCLSAREDRESSFHHSGGPVNLM